MKHAPRAQSNAERKLRQLETEARQRSAWTQSRRGEAIHRFPTHDVDRHDELIVHYEGGEYRYVMWFPPNIAEPCSRMTVLRMLGTQEQKKEEAQDGR